MPPVTEIDLPHLAVESPEFAADPMPFLEAARRRHPWLATCKDGYFVHGYQAVKDLLYMDDKLLPPLDNVVEFYGAQGTRFERFLTDTVLARSGASHQRVRDSVAAAFTPRAVNQQMPVARRAITALLDEWAPKGRFDFAEFASFFPVSVLCGILGTSTSGVLAIRDAINTMTKALSMDRDLLPELLAAHDRLWDFVDGQVAERTGHGAGGGLLDQLIQAKATGRIDEDELRYLLMVLFIGGYDTSRNMLTLIMHTMIDRPAEWERCASDRLFCDKVTEEMLRHTSLVTAFRKVGENFVYDDVQFSQGALLIFANSVAGRDPAAFEDPMEFLPERTSANRHVAFGRGAHICIGQHLARMQIAEGLHLIAQRITHPRRTGDVAWRPFQGVWGLSTLPIEFTPATS